MTGEGKIGNGGSGQYKLRPEVGACLCVCVCLPVCFRVYGGVWVGWWVRVVRVCVCVFVACCCGFSCPEVFSVTGEGKIGNGGSGQYKLRPEACACPCVRVYACFCWGAYVPPLACVRVCACD